jgi:IPTL-CTERM motif
MTRLSKLVLVITVLVIPGFYSYQSAYGWEAVAQTYELFAVGTVEGTEKSYLYTIHPVTGEITMIGDTELNNCKAIDFNSEGKLKAFCEARDEDAVTTKGLVAGGAVIAELDTETGRATWAVPHGATNNISDIAIRDDDVLFSYENLETDNLHRHEETTDFQAMFIGSPGIEAQYHGMSHWNDINVKVAANVEGMPGLYSVNVETGESVLKTELTFPAETEVVMSAENATRFVMAEGVQILAMDKVNFPVGGVATASTKNILGGYAFAETQAEFAVLIGMNEKQEKRETVSTRDLGILDWAAIVLIEAESGLVDYMVPIETDVQVMGIALRQRAPAQVPTLSEWGLIATAVLLFAGALVFMRRRGLSIQS